MHKILTKVRLQIYKIANRLCFLIIYPYLKPSKILGFRQIKLPLIFSIGSHFKLIVTNPSDRSKNNIIVEKDTWFGDGVELNTSKNGLIHIKEFVSIQDRCKIIGNVVINRHTILAPNVFISSGTHQAFIKPYLTIREQDKLASSQVYAFKHFNIIEEDCWIGVNVFIKSGVCIGRGAVIGANSVITKDIPPYAVVVGSSKVLNNRLNFEPPLFIDMQLDLSSPYLYRGFSKELKFWLNDNLTIFRKLEGRIKLKIAYEIALSSGILEFASNGQTSCVLHVEQGSEACESFFVANEVKEVFPALLDKYFCIKLTRKNGVMPNMLSIEISLI